MMTELIKKCVKEALAQMTKDGIDYKQMSCFLNQWKVN